MFKHHEIFPFTVWQEQTASAFTTVKLPERGSGISVITVACSYFSVAILRVIPDYTHDYKSRDPQFKYTYSEKVFAPYTIFLCPLIHLCPEAPKQITCVTLAQREMPKTIVQKTKKNQPFHTNIFLCMCVYNIKTQKPLPQKSSLHPQKDEVKFKNKQSKYSFGFIYFTHLFRLILYHSTNSQPISSNKCSILLRYCCKLGN